jgi:beta-lactamase class A
LRIDPDQLGLVIEHPASGIRVEHAPDRRFAAASLYKVGIAYEVLRQASAGDLSLDDPVTIRAVDAVEEETGGLAIGSMLTVREALQAAIGPSSNAAAFALMRLIGRPRLNQSLVELPLRQTGVPLLVGDTALPGSPVLDPQQAVTTPEDMAHILTRLGRDQLLGPEASQLFRDMLALEDPWNPIGDALPPDVPILAKTGTLPGIRNIAALIGTSCGWVTLVVLTEDVDPASAHETVGALAQSIYTVFGVRGGC